MKNIFTSYLLLALSISLECLAEETALPMAANPYMAASASSNAPKPKVKSGAGSPIYVKHDAVGTNDGTSWQNAYTSLQAALDAAAADTEIWVAKGTYYPTESPDGSTADPRDKSFHFNEKLLIYGGFAGNEVYRSERNFETNPTILSGDFNNDDVITGQGSTLNIANNSENAYRVMLIGRTSGDGIVVDGFTIKGGNANGTGLINYEAVVAIERNVGGAIYVRQTTSQPPGIYGLIVNNITFTGNNASIKGGAVFNQGTTSLTHAKFIKNKAHVGAGVASQNKTYIFDAVFDGNHATYKGGGVSADSSQTILIERAYFRNNYAVHLGGGLAIEGLADSKVNNAVFVNNSARLGGAVFTSLDETKITNSTFSRNTATNGGGIVFSNLSSPTLKNTIFWANTGSTSINNVGYVVHPHPYMSGLPAGTYTQTNTLIEGFGNANSNIDTNPLFLNENDVDGADNILFTIDDGFNINSCSPAINAGTNTDIPATDILNNVRPYNNVTADIGAFEHIGLPAPTNLTTSENAICVSTDISLSASCAVGTVTWYNQATGGTAIGTGSPLSQNVSATTTFYASCKEVCSESNRTASGQVTFGWGIGGLAAPFQIFSTVGENSLLFYKTTISQGMTVDSMAVIAGSIVYANSRIKLAIYSDNGGVPQTLLASSPGNSNTSLPYLPAGTSKFPLTSPVYLNAGTYWIGFVLSSQEFILINQSGANAGYYKAQTFDNALPTIMTGLLPNANQEFNVYFSGELDCSPPPIPTGVSATPDSICIGSTVTLLAACATGTVVWYDFALGGVVLGTGSPFIQSPTTDTYYYATCKNNIYESNRVSTGRVAVINVADPDPIRSLKTIYCLGEPLLLAASCNSGAVHWYNQATGGAIVGTGDGVSISTLPGIQSSITYYATCANANCESNRIPLAINIGTNTRKYVKYDAVGANDGTSWQNAYTSLQPALDASCVGTEIWVAKGTYYPTESPDGSIADPRNKSFHVDARLLIYGGFAGNETLLTERNIEANPTILSGDFNNDDIITGEGSTLNILNNGENAYHVMIIMPIFNARGIILDGFIIKGGNANGTGNTMYNELPYSQNSGGGLNFIDLTYAPGNYSIIANNLTFIGNSASFKGGAIRDNGITKVTNSKFIRNKAFIGGGIGSSSSITTLADLIFDGNMATYKGGAMSTDTSNSLNINRVYFKNNHVEHSGGALAIERTNSVINNAVFVNNSSRIGGAIFSAFKRDSSVLITNSTFSKNRATDGGGLAYSNGAEISLKNSIFWGNTATNTSNNVGFVVHPNPLAAAYPVGTHTQTNTLIEGFGNANSNIDTNPLFLDENDVDGADNTLFTADDGFNLTGCSPAINAGTNTVVPTTDILNNIRPYNGGTADIGAFEYAGLPASTSVSTSQTSICGPTTISLTATCAMGVVTWYNQATGGSAIGAGSPLSQTVSTSTTFYASCKDACGESSRTATQQITYGASGPPAVFESNPSVCINKSILLSATCPGGTVSWYNANTSTLLYTGQMFTTPNLSTNTTYKVRCEDSPCSSSFVDVNVTISANLNVQISGSANLTCATTSVTRTASGGSGTPPAGYQWSNGLGNNATATMTAAGTYTVTVTNANGCTATATTAVTLDSSLPSAPIITAPNPKVVCAPNTLTLTASGCAGTINWSNGLSGISLTLSSVGTYSISATCTVGSCTSLASSTVTGLQIVNQPSAPTITAPNPKVVCSPSTLVLTASGCAGTVTWSTGSSGTSLTLSTVGTYSISATCTVGSCTSVTSSTITGLQIVNQPSAPTITAPNPKVVCAPSTLVLTASGCAGTINWSNGSSGTSITLSSAGTYSISATCTVGSCTSVASSVVTGLQIVNQPSAPTITAPNPKVVCIPSTLVLTASGCAGTITWSNSSSGSSLTLSSVGTYSISATCSVGSCTSVASSVVTGLQIVTQPSAPTITAPNPKIVCAPNTLTLTASGCAGIVTWSNSSSGTSLTLSSVGTYSISATCSVGSCTSVASSTVTGLQIVTQPSAPTITAPNPRVMCSPSTLTLTASGCAGIVNWANGSSGTSLTLSSVGTYSISATCTVGSCTSVASSVVTGLQIVASPLAQASNTGPYNLGQTIELSASGGTSYIWSGPASFTSSIQNPTLPSALVSNGGIYTVTVANNACSATATTNVIINGVEPCNKVIDYQYVISGLTSQHLFSLTNGMTIQQSSLETSILALPMCPDVNIESLDMSIVGPDINWSIMQNIEPYAIFDNVGQHIYGYRFIPGTYTMTVTGYAADNRGGGVSYGPVTTTFTIVASAASISTPTLSNNTICAGSSVNVTFSATGSFAPGNEFQVQMSDITGSFVNPTIIGTSNAAGTVACQIPQNVAGGSGYLIRVVSTNQVLAASPTINALSIIPSVKNFVTDVNGGNISEQASQKITATHKIISPANVTYNAGKAIILAPGFEAREGSIFKAQIQACNN